MSVLRQLNVLGQMRLDVPHLRSIESGVAADFDALAGNIMAGGVAYVVRGFSLKMDPTPIGSSATSLQLEVADAALLHPLASESGSIFRVDEDAANEVLSVSNDKVIGGFTASATNYVGIDLRRLSDDSTSDLVMFIDANTGLQTPKTVPLARTLDFRIVVSTTDFAATPHVCPVAKVVTDSTNLVTSIVDCRQMLFRLGSGGTSPDSGYVYPWTANRNEAGASSIFAGGDKQLESFKDLFAAIQTRLWELGGGPYWYSVTTDREVILAKGPNIILAAGDNFDWDLGTQTLQWQDLSLIFANTPGRWNEIDDGSIVLLDGECAYVDVDRTEDRVIGVDPLIMAKAPLITLGQPDVPGSRYVIAWRKGNYVYARDRDHEVGRLGTVATNLIQGVVKLSYAAGTPADPLVPPLDANGRVSAVATGGNSEGLRGTGIGSGAGVYGVSGATGVGVWGEASAGTGAGVEGQGFAGPGVKGRGNTAGVYGEAYALTTAPGVEGHGGTLSGPGVYGVGGAANGIGVVGEGDGTGQGVRGTGGDSDGVGVEGIGGTLNGTGVKGTGDGTGYGVLGTGGDDGGTGVRGVGGAVDGVGVSARSNGNGIALSVLSPGTGQAISAISTSGAIGAFLSAPAGTAVYAAAGGNVTMLADVTGTTIEPDSTCVGLRVQNTGSGNNTISAIALMHEAADTNDDGWMIYSRRAAEDDTYLNLAYSVDDGVASPMATLNSSGLCVGDNGGSSTSGGCAVEVRGGLAFTHRGTATLTADNQSVSTTNLSFIGLTSDDATATNRTFTLTNGRPGQMLVLCWISAVNAGEIQSSANCHLSATWTPNQYDTLTLIYEENMDWLEIARSANT